MESNKPIIYEDQSQETLEAHVHGQLDALIGRPPQLGEAITMKRPTIRESYLRGYHGLLSDVSTPEET